MKTHFDQSIFPTHSENWDFSHQMFFSDQWNSAPWRPPIGNRGNRGLGTPLLRSFTLFCRLRWTFKVSRQISYWVDSAPIPWGMATFCSNSPTILCSTTTATIATKINLPWNIPLIYTSVVRFPVWKFQDFSVTQISLEINFGEARSSKTAVFAIFGALNLVIW